MTCPSTILICLAGSGAGAGPVTTAPLVILNSLPWHGQSMVPLATVLMMQPTCVHTALNPWYWPRAGAGLDDMPPEPGVDAWLVVAPELGMPPCAGPFGGIPASLAS